MMPCSSSWKLFLHCGVNFEPLGLRSLHIKTKFYHHSFQPDRVWKLIFRATNGLHFATLSWNLSSTKVWFSVQSLVLFCSLCSPFLGGGKQPFCRGALPGAGSHQTVPSPPAHSNTLPLSPAFLQAQGSPGDEASPAPDAWMGLLYPVTLSNAPVWSLLPAEPLSGGLLCCALDLCQAIQLECSESSVWPKQPLMIVNLSSHEVQSHFHPLHPFTGVLLINSNSRGNIMPTKLPLGPFACLSDFSPDCYPDINSFSNLVFMTQKYLKI